MKLRQNTKRIFTAALIVWMSGIVVLFCCEMPAANAASEEIESCPLAKKGNCSKTSESDSSESFKQTPLSSDCCVFPAKIFDKARKLENSPSSPAVAESVKIAAPRLSLIKKISESPQFYQSFVRNRGSTHLRNCVLRI